MHQKEVKDVLSALHASEAGLSAHQAEKRLHKYGLNEIREEAGIQPLKIFLQQFNSSLVWILLAALMISLFLKEYVDASVIGIIVVLNAVLGFVQEYRAEKAIEALRKMASSKALVLRNGKEIRIDSKYVVPGDILLLETGDKVPADARLLEIHSLETQEAPLTGESQPVTKELQVLAEKTPLADRKNMIYSSTVISQGRGRAIVTATGMETEVGKIATLIQEKEDSLTPLQRKMKELGKYITLVVVLVALLVFGVGVFSGNAISTMFLTSIALAVAAIPEGLPAVITIALAVGVKRMVKRNALVRRLPSVETLGSVNVICTDKTGTLTHNQMTVTKIWANNQIYGVTGSGYSSQGKFLQGEKEVRPDALQGLLKIGALCNNAKLYGTDDKAEVVGDPTEAALLVSARKSGLERDVLEQKERREEEIPFSSERKMMTTFHQTTKGLFSYTKGAPDIILDRCDKIFLNGKVVRLDRALKKEILQKNEEFAEQALRVLGFAYNKDITGDNAEKNMIFVGLQAMIDPPRTEVKATIAQCRKAGIRVIMITGDQLLTAKAIASQLGITGEAITGSDLEKIDLAKEINDLGIFARVDPEHKLQIIKALKRKGYIVAMTGDGVNDAPALKKADIGVSMGITGTDVAKEAADMILTDDNFTSIVNAVEEGRGVYDNIKKFFAFLFSGNIGEVGIIALALLFGLPLPLPALLILFINLVTDGLPAVALGVDPFEPKAMLRPPRKVKEPFYAGLSPFLVYYPIIMIGVALSFFTWMVKTGQDLIKAQTVVFLIIVLFELYQAFASRSIRYPSVTVGLFRNHWLVIAVAVSLLATLAIIYLPFFQRIFGTAALSLAEFIVIALVSSLGFVYLEIHKYVRVKKERKA